MLSPVCALRVQRVPAGAPWPPVGTVSGSTVLDQALGHGPRIPDRILCPLAGPGGACPELMLWGLRGTTEQLFEGGVGGASTCSLAPMHVCQAPHNEGWGRGAKRRGARLRLERALSQLRRVLKEETVLFTVGSLFKKNYKSYHH